MLSYAEIEKRLEMPAWLFNLCFASFLSLIARWVFLDVYGREMLPWEVIIAFCLFYPIKIRNKTFSLFGGDGGDGYIFSLLSIMQRGRKCEALFSLSFFSKAQETIYSNIGLNFLAKAKEVESFCGMNICCTQQKCGCVIGFNIGCTGGLAIGIGLNVLCSSRVASLYFGTTIEEGQSILCMIGFNILSSGEIRNCFGSNILCEGCIDTLVGFNFLSRGEVLVAYGINILPVGVTKAEYGFSIFHIGKNYAFSGINILPLFMKK